VGIFNLSLFGMDPFQVFAHGIWMHTSVGFGTFYTIVNLLMLISIVIICFGSAMYFTGDLGVSTYDAVALILSEKKFAKFQYCRMGIVCI